MFMALLIELSSSSEKFPVLSLLQNVVRLNPAFEQTDLSLNPPERIISLIFMNEYKKKGEIPLLR